MKDQDWLLLKTLFKTKNITKAANQLYISQPALTHRIQQIEQEFGVSIIHRSKRGIQFTPEGEYLVLCADRMLLHLKKIQDHIQHMQGGYSGTLRIGATNVFTKYKLPKILSMFSQLYPKISFEVTTKWSKEIYNLLNAQKIHVGFIRADYQSNDYKHLLDTENICIASKKPIKLEKLPYQKRIDYKKEPTIQALIDKWWRDNFNVPPSIGMHVARVDNSKEMVVHGLGYAIMPENMLNGEKKIYKIVMRSKNGDPLTRKTWMIYNEEYQQLLFVQKFIKFVKGIDIRKI